MSNKTKLVVTVSLGDKDLVRWIKRIEDLSKIGTYSVASLLEEPFTKAEKKLIREIRQAKDEM